MTEIEITMETKRRNCSVCQPEPPELCTSVGAERAFLAPASSFVSSLEGYTQKGVLKLPVRHISTVSAWSPLRSQNCFKPPAAAHFHAGRDTGHFPSKANPKPPRIKFLF